MLHINPNVEEAARNLGKRPMEVLTSVTLPLLRPGLLTGFALVFLTCMKELPATLLLSPTGFQTLATRIWNTTEEAYYTRAAAPALLLILVAGITIWIITKQEESDSVCLFFIPDYFESKSILSPSPRNNHGSQRIKI